MLFKILHGDPSNISLDVTPFHEGWAYVTHDGFFYIDLNIGTVESPNNQRIKLNSHNAEALCGMSLDELKNEITTQDAVILHEAQTYADNAIVQAKTSGDLKGEKGDDGVSATHYWSGTTLTVTSASGTSSVDLKGEKGDQGEPGADGEKGADGAKGADGYTPVRGTDYWTDTDKEEIKAYVDEAILNGAW